MQRLAEQLSAFAGCSRDAAVCSAFLRAVLPSDQQQASEELTQLLRERPGAEVAWLCMLGLADHAAHHTSDTNERVAEATVGAVLHSAEQQPSSTEGRALLARLSRAAATLVTPLSLAPIVAAIAPEEDDEAWAERDEGPRRLAGALAMVEAVFEATTSSGGGGGGGGGGEEKKEAVGRAVMGATLAALRNAQTAPLRRNLLLARSHLFFSLSCASASELWEAMRICPFEETVEALCRAAGASSSKRLAEVAGKIEWWDYLFSRLENWGLRRNVPQYRGRQVRVYICANILIF
jgi:hypothetical protein